MHFVSYYYDKNPQESTYYTDCKNRLEQQLIQYNHKCSFDYIDFENQGLDTSYLKLNMIKPTYLLQKIDQLNDSVSWIDADCIVNGHIDEFENLDNEFDMAICIREHDNITPHAGLIYFNKTENSIKFLKEWESINNIKKNDESYKCSEHCTLIDLYNTTNIPLKIKKYTNLARSGDYGMGRFSKTKVWIGISPAAWEYERARTQ